MSNRESEAKTERGGPLRPGIRSRDERGAMLALVAMAMVGLMGMLVLTLDAGFLHRQRRMAQTAADAGAQAGALEILRLHRDSAVAAAFSETSRNGFTNGSDNVVVTVNNPPISGPHTGDTLFVEVVVQQTLATFFGNVVNRPSVSLQPRGVAGVLQPANGCLYVLDPSMAKALEIKNNGAELIAEDCAVIVNSNDANDAISVTSAAAFEATSIAVTGGAYVSPPAYMTPEAETGVPPVEDPLASRVMPDVSGACDYTNVQIGNGTVTMGPGVYCGGIKIGGGTTVVNLTPGLYILKGGGLDVGASSTLNALGVTFINTNGPPNNPNKFGILFIHSGADVHLSAMTTGALSGILFYQDPLAGQAGHYYENHLHSNATSDITGVIYLPTQGLELGGSNATVTINGGVVAKNVTVKSSGSVHLRGGVGGGGVGAFTRAAIVE